MRITISYKVPGGGLIESHAKETEDYSLQIQREDTRFTLSILPKKTIVLKKAQLRFAADFSETAGFFVNGYQSWTATKEYTPEEEMHSLNYVPGPLQEQFSFAAYGDYWFRRYKRGELHGFTFAYTRDGEDNCDLIGSFNEENAFLVITYQKERNRICLESDCEGRKIDQTFVLFDFGRYKGKTQEVLKKYFSCYGTCEAPPVRGYTSWYLHYQDINQEKMMKTLASVNADRFDLFQIDDGYETFVGDWLDIDPLKFPEGLNGIVDEIHAKGLQAGIWLAPFVCEKNSRVFAEHPDWVYRDKTGEPVMAGSNWSGFMPLDIRRADVRQYIRQCLKYYIDAGFDFFKLDFLYAVGLIRSSRFTRAELMRYAMVFLWAILSEKKILGCGVPLASAFNLVDYCRIGPDISLEFDDKIYMRPMHNERISTKNTLQNTIYRSCMDGTVFRCDPDVYLLRDNDISLSKETREAVTMINHLCGAVYLTSDDPGNYDEEKQALLRRAEELTGAEIKSVLRDGDIITIHYSKEDITNKLIYDTNRGIILGHAPASQNLF